MENTPTTNRGSDSAAVINLNNNLKAGLAAHFGLEDSKASEQANLLISLAEAHDFFDGLEEERSQATEPSDFDESKGESDTDEEQGIDPHLMVDRMESGFDSAFEDAFGTERANYTDLVSYAMERLEDAGIIDELMAGFPATGEDVARLGILEGGDSAYEFLPRNTVEFICESLLNDAEDDESKARAQRRIETLMELFTRVHNLVGRSGPSDETIVDLNWALKQLVVLTQVGLPREPVESEAAGKILLKSLGQLSSD